MNISQFLENYAESDFTRAHMPGHKGYPLTGCEPQDITEIKGADSLYTADGIIAESERLTANAFGSRRTCYSAEGSSLSIKAMLAVVRRFFGREITVVSPRNCHAAFINGCALLGIEPVWITPDSPRCALCECCASPSAVAAALKKTHADAVYITSPDYYGYLADIAGIAKVCHEHGALLLVDNAHGAYLKFVGGALHPLDLGADMVCDSAHKTLPVLTGGGYLHISKSAPAQLADEAKSAMLLFGSTSPSYLIMRSLDRCAELLHGDLHDKISDCCCRIFEIKNLMRRRGIPDLADEPMKITVGARRCGFSGSELAELMRAAKIEPEYCDPEAVVLMLSPYNSERDFERLEKFFGELPVHSPADQISTNGERELSELFALPLTRAVSTREAMLAAAHAVSVDDAEGKICARAAMSCQPAVAIVMPGEIISDASIKILKKYSISEIFVL